MVERKLPGFSESADELKSVITELFKSDDLKRLTEIPPSMIMPIVRLEVRRRTIEADFLGEPFDVGEVTTQAFYELMLSKDRTSRKELLALTKVVGSLKDEEEYTG